MPLIFLLFLALSLVSAVDGDMDLSPKEGSCVLVTMAAPAEEERSDIGPPAGPLCGIDLSRCERDPRSTGEAITRRNDVVEHVSDAYLCVVAGDGNDELRLQVFVNTFSCLTEASMECWTHLQGGFPFSQYDVCRLDAYGTLEGLQCIPPIDPGTNEQLPSLLPVEFESDLTPGDDACTVVLITHSADGVFVDEYDLDLNDPSCGVDLKSCSGVEEQLELIGGVETRLGKATCGTFFLEYETVDWSRCQDLPEGECDFNAIPETVSNERCQYDSYEQVFAARLCKGSVPMQGEENEDEEDEESFTSDSVPAEAGEDLMPVEGSCVAVSYRPGKSTPDNIDAAAGPLCGLDLSSCFLEEGRPEVYEEANGMLHTDTQYWRCGEGDDVRAVLSVSRSTCEDGSPTEVCWGALQTAYDPHQYEECWVDRTGFYNGVHCVPPSDPESGEPLPPYRLPEYRTDLTATEQGCTLITVVNRESGGRIRPGDLDLDAPLCGIDVSSCTGLEGTTDVGQGVEVRTGRATCAGILVDFEVFDWTACKDLPDPSDCMIESMLPLDGAESQPCILDDYYRAAQCNGSTSMVDVLESGPAAPPPPPESAGLTGGYGGGATTEAAYGEYDGGLGTAESEKATVVFGGSSRSGLAASVLALVLAAAALSLA